MSNLIKGYQINYSENVRRVDLNPKADVIEQRFLEEYLNKNMVPKSHEFEALAGNIEEIASSAINEADQSMVYRKETEPADVEIHGEALGQVETEALQRIEENNRLICEQEEKLTSLSKEADRILDDARAEVKRMLSKAASDAENQVEALYEDAKNRGYNDGIDEGGRELEKLRKELEQEQASHEEEYRKQVQELEPAFVSMVIKYVNKLTGIYSESKKDIITYLIHQTMIKQDNYESYIIRVSAADYETVKINIEAIKAVVRDNAVVEILEDKLLKKNQCMIETESRVFDCSLDEQLKGLTDDLKLLGGL